MGKTTIEWCDEVWNPVTGCDKVSTGCYHCYAEAIAKRFWGERKFNDIQLHFDRLDVPGKWRKPRRVFVNSMSDLFHADVPFNFIATVFYRMGQYDRHTYIVSTKRPDRMFAFFNWWQDELIPYSKQNGIPFFSPPMENVWILVSVENMRAADKRIPLLLKIPAVVRGLSIEPMLEPINLDVGLFNYLRLGIDWVICGCESGVGARPFNPDWARSLRDQCKAASVPFFFKQGRVDGKIAKMPELDGEVWSEFPKVQR